MNNTEKARLKRRTTLVCLLAAELAKHGLPYTDILSRVASKNEYIGVVKYVTNHVHFPDTEDWIED